MIKNCPKDFALLLAWVSRLKFFFEVLDYCSEKE
jgi:hypothetical protein